MEPPIYDLEAKNYLRALLTYIGEDPERDGLKETPARILKAWRTELFKGYHENPADVVKVFDNEKYDEFILLKNVEIYSTCEHHLLPFFGVGHVAYIPNGGRVIGISKLARLVEIFSRRLQIQERLTDQITETIDKHLKPLGVACVIQARHLCMSCRGVNKQHSEMVTSSLKGAFRQPEVRAEFFNLIKS